MRKKAIEYDFLVHNISEEDQQGYMAIIPAFNNAIVFGDDLDELEEGVRFTIETEIEDLRKAKKPVPKPERKSKYSGKLIIRIDPHLHEKLSLESKAKQVSLNKYIETKLSK